MPACCAICARVASFQRHSSLSARSRLISIARPLSASLPLHRCVAVSLFRCAAVSLCRCSCFHRCLCLCLALSRTLTTSINHKHARALPPTPFPTRCPALRRSSHGSCTAARSGRQATTGAGSRPLSHSLVPLSAHLSTRWRLGHSNAGGPARPLPFPYRQRAPGGTWRPGLRLPSGRVPPLQETRGGGGARLCWGRVLFA